MPVHLGDFSDDDILYLISLAGPAFDFAAGHGKRIAKFFYGDPFEIGVFLYP